MKRIILLVVLGILLIGGYSNIYGENSWDDEMAMIKTKYDFVHWPGKEGKIKDGFQLTEATFPDLKLVKSYLGSGRGDYEWKKEGVDGYVEVCIRLAKTCEEAQENIIWLFASSSREGPDMPRRRTGKEMGLKIGDISFPSRIKGEKKLLRSIDFTRNNIFVEIDSDGAMEKYVTKMTLKIDSLIKAQPDVASLEQSQRKPIIKRFEIAEDPVVLSPPGYSPPGYKEVPLIIEIDDPAGGKLKCSFTDNMVTMGGVTDEGNIYKGRWVAYFDYPKPGKYKITLTVINDYLLTSTAEIEFTVIEKE